MDNRESLGKYQLRAIIGEGGMGIVYEAYDPHLARSVAIKTIRRSLLEGRSGHDLRERFRREARAEGRLTHSNIVTIFEYQEDVSGMPFFVMEFVEGENLKEHLARGTRFSLDKTVHIVRQVLQALSYSHRKGVIHRDIKPANIILLDDETVKIADFGIAKMEESEFTQTGMVMGTPQYIAPEQRLGLHTDGRADLYSTGVVMYEMLSGRKYSHAPGGGTLLSQLRQTGGGHLDPGDVVVQRVFRTVVTRALAQDPGERFATADEFLEALESVRISSLKRRGDSRWWHTMGLGVGLGVVLLVGWLGWGQLRPAPGPAAPAAKIAPLPRPPAEPLSLEQQRKVEDHLRVGRMHMLVGRLIAPPGSSAFDSFELALAIDSGNVEARAGLARVEQELLERIAQLEAQGDESGAAELRLSAREHFPDSEALGAEGG